MNTCEYNNIILTPVPEDLNSFLPNLSVKEEEYERLFPAVGHFRQVKVELNHLISKVPDICNFPLNVTHMNAGYNYC